MLAVAWPLGKLKLVSTTKCSNKGRSRLKNSFNKGLTMIAMITTLLANQRASIYFFSTNENQKNR